jgi:hypothetical protein
MLGTIVINSLRQKVQRAGTRIDFVCFGHADGESVSEYDRKVVLP